MLMLALTGGIASGKSVVAERLVELGAVLVDSDLLAREVVAPGSIGLARIIETFGAGVLAPDGSLDRKALGAIVFADGERRAQLNAITHPLIGERAEALIAAAAPDAVIVRDIPLFIESGADPRAFDLVITMTADIETRIRRMVERRGMTREEAIQRIEAQAPETARLAIADVVIRNDGDLVDTLHQVDELWASLPTTAQRRQRSPRA
jgi:dephospho-CoA kinase